LDTHTDEKFVYRLITDFTLLGIYLLLSNSAETYHNLRGCIQKFPD